MFAVLNQVLKRLVQTGHLTVTDAEGRAHVYGDGSGKPAGFKIVDRTAPIKIVLDPDRYFGEAYMNGGIDLTQGTIYDLLEVLLKNVEYRPAPGASKLFNNIRIAMKRLDQYNPIGRAQANVAHHYDLSGALYALFLDRDRQYSCAYFPDADNEAGISLEQAQEDKKAHIAAKLHLKPGMKVLDIGCGWGGMALYLHRTCGVDVTGITLSEEQLKVARQRAQDLGVADHVRFELIDYRDIEGPFDRIVSVGMFEHVGTKDYRTFYNKCRDLLTPDGVMLIHTIGRVDGPGITDAFTQKYIFPGGYIPALSEMIQGSEGTRLMVTDVEVLRMHYGLTIREWYKRTLAHKADIIALYDERFFRLWTFYLAGAATVFEHGSMVNYQVQYVRDRRSLPITRDYMLEAEGALRGR